MKKIFLALIAFTAVNLATAQNFTIKGNIKGITSDVIGLDYMGSNLPEGVESRHVINKEATDSKFIITGTVLEPTVLRIGFWGDDVMTKADGMHIFNSMNVFAVVAPGDKLTVKGKATDYPNSYIKNNYENKIMAKINAAYFPAMNDYLNVMAASFNNKDKQYKVIDADLEAKYKSDMDVLSKKYTALMIEAVSDNISSIAGLWYLSDMLNRGIVTAEKGKEMLEKVNSKYFSTYYYKTCTAYIDGILNVKVGFAVPKIVTTQTTDGSTFDLSTLKGKYVVIDFWGTWCGPCMAGMPKLKAYKEKYGDKLQVVAIAKDRRENWDRELAKGNMPFINLLNGANDEDFVTKFAVNGFPTKLIISPEGEIIYRASGESEKFYNKLDELLK